MNRFLVAVLLTISMCLGAQVSAAPVTFNKDVLPILQKDCQVCHRPGGAGPMSFLTYESTRPWAKAIKEKVVGREMPPWFADPRYGEFRNAPKLTAADIKTLGEWSDSGAPEGDMKDAPTQIQWADGWRTQPDVIVSMPEPYTIRAKGEGEIKTFMVPNPFQQDTWVTSIEVRPGNPSVVHHVIVQVPEVDAPTGFAWGGFQQVRGPLARDGRRQSGGQGGYYGDGSGTAVSEFGTFATMEAVFAPGAPPLDFRFHNSAKLIPGGRPIRIEVHYTPNGKAASDQTMIGFTLATEPAKRRFVMMAPTTLVEKDSFRLPAGASNWKSTGEIIFTENAELVWFMPHMHLRGKDMTFQLLYPNGRTETVLKTKFNFLWQLGYEVETPIRIPKGTKMIVTAHHDNSANNPFNPDPTQNVRWGELTSQEMVLPWFGVVVDRAVDPDKIAFYRPTDPNSEKPRSEDPPSITDRVRQPLPTPPFSPRIR
jgi:hypothetical protein